MKQPLIRFGAALAIATLVAVQMAMLLGAAVTNLMLPLVLKGGSEVLTALLPWLAWVLPQALWGFFAAVWLARRLETPHSRWLAVPFAITAVVYSWKSRLGDWPWIMILGLWIPVVEALAVTQACRARAMVGTSSSRTPRPPWTLLLAAALLNPLGLLLGPWAIRSLRAAEHWPFQLGLWTAAEVVVPPPGWVFKFWGSAFGFGLVSTITAAALPLSFLVLKRPKTGFAARHCLALSICLVGLPGVWMWLYAASWN